MAIIQRQGRQLGGRDVVEDEPIIVLLVSSPSSPCARHHYSREGQATSKPLTGLDSSQSQARDSPVDAPNQISERRPPA